MSRFDVDVMSAAYWSATCRGDHLVRAYITGLLLQPSDLVNRSLEVSTLVCQLRLRKGENLPLRAPQPEAVEP